MNQLLASQETGLSNAGPAFLVLAKGATKVGREEFAKDSARLNAKVKGEMALEQLDEFLASIEKRAFSMARVAVANDADALDIVQDAMMKLVENYREKPAKEWKPLFYRILHNRIMDFHRGAKHRRLFVAGESAANDDDSDMNADLLERTAVSEESPAGQFAADRLGKNIMAAIESLPVRQQQCFLLRSWEGLSVKETAAAMRLNSGSVKVHYSRALAKLKAVLEE
jgi:RNA polymerase sigma-70 factor, ECF subfamily